MPDAERRTPAEILRGRVERVLYHTEDTGYCILKVLPEGAREAVGLVGRTPRVVAGEAFEATGHWQSSRDYGRQFKADSLQLERRGIYENFLLLALHHAMLNTLLIGQAAYWRRDFNRKHAAELIQSFAKTIGHNRLFLNQALGFLAAANLNDAAGVAVLVKN